MALKFAVAVAPFPLNTLLENAPVLPEALLKKPVDHSSAKSSLTFMAR